MSKTSLCTTQTLSVVDDVDVDPEVFGEWGEKIAAEKGSIRSSSSQLEGQGAWKREELLVRQQRRHRHGLWVPVTKVCARRSTIYMHSNIWWHTSASRTLIFMCGDFQTSTDFVRCSEPSCMKRWQAVGQLYSGCISRLEPSNNGVFF